MGMTAAEFERVYAAHGTRLLRIAHLVGDPAHAEDAVAEVFAQCWKRWQRVIPDDAGAYLRRSLLHQLERDGRRRGRDRYEVVGVVAADEGDAVDVARDVRAALAALPFERRVVVVLRYLDDVSEAEVARMLEVPVGTVKSRAARGLRELEPILRPVREVADD